MEMFVKTEDVELASYPDDDDALSCATESKLLPYFPRLKLRHAEEGRSCNSSSSSSSPASLSSASISTLSKDLLDFEEECFELRAKGQSRIYDEEFYRFSAAFDLNLLEDATFSYLDLFSVSDSVITNPDDLTFDPDSENASEFSTNFDEFHIPTCVTDISALDDHGYGAIEQKFIPLFELLDDDFLGTLSNTRDASTRSTNPKTEGRGGRGGRGEREEGEEGGRGGGERRKRGRPRKAAASAKGENPPSISNNEFRNQRSRRRRRRETSRKGHHLWEFIRELLESSEDGAGEEGEQLVRWENREKGVFLIVNSREVAELWGKRKRNSTMTYEKLSRSLRWCRSSGFLAEVPKDRKYPKKLCFCFGHRAYNIHGTTTAPTPPPHPPPPPHPSPLSSQSPPTTTTTT